MGTGEMRQAQDQVSNFLNLSVTVHTSGVSSRQFRKPASIQEPEQGRRSTDRESNAVASGTAFFKKKKKSGRPSMAVLKKRAIDGHHMVQGSLQSVQYQSLDLQLAGTARHK